MKVHELLVKLAATFPGSFNTPQAATEWGSIYHEALGRYEGAILQAAYGDLMTAWGNGYAPKPAEFALRCNAIEQQRQHSAGRLNFGEGASRPFNWARYILANPGKYCVDAERAARQLVGDVAEAAE